MRIPKDHENAPHVKLVNDDETKYITAHEGQGMSISPYKFLEAHRF